MKLIFIFSVLCCSSFTCKTKQKAQLERQIRGIHVNYQLPVLTKDLQLEITNTDYDVYYWKDLLIYTNSYQFDSVVNKELILDEKRNQYFAFHKDSSFCLRFEDNFSLPPQRMRLDSIIELISLNSLAYDSFATVRPDSIYSNEKGDLIKKFKSQSSKTSPEDYTIWFYYNKEFDWVKETFSTRMDNEIGMKLYKIILNAEEANYPGIKLPERKISVEMTEMKRASELIKSIFEWYINQN